MIEPLFFFCYYAYLLGDLEKARMYFSVIREEYSAVGTPNSLKEHQFLELKKIKEAITTGNISRSKWLDETAPGPPRSSDIKIKQAELVKRIHTEGLEQLKEILQDDIYLYNIEHPCGSYGTVDMVYMGKNTIYPLEVKRGRGEHDLIGQISKYDLHHRLQLHYKHYEYVRSVTICNSYDPFTIQELRTMGVLPLNYSLNKEDIRIEAL
jgi:hypothetical protein